MMLSNGVDKKPKKGEYLDILLRSPKTIFSTKDAALLWAEERESTVSARLNKYVKAGKLIGVRRGLYAKDKNYDKFELATKIYTPSYISFETVLAKAGVIFQFYGQVFVASYITREVVVDGQTYSYKRIRDQILTDPTGVEAKNSYYIASSERAFLDIVYASKGYHFDNLSPLDWAKVFEILSRYKNILIKILKDLYTDTGIGPVLGFKGGTAAYLYHGLSRESLDLDFDLLDETKGDQVFEKIEAVAKNYGKIKEHRKKRYNLFLLLSYEDEAPNIKIEINRREFGSKYEVKSYLGISMKVMIREDMFAHKLVAMYERMGAANRDIYDVWFFLEKDWPVNKEIVEKRTGMLFKDFLQKCVEALEKLPDRGILAGMDELLDEKQKAWVKTKLRTEVIFQLKLRMENEK